MKCQTWSLRCFHRGPVMRSTISARMPRRPLLAYRTRRLDVHCMANYRWSAEQDGGRRKREALFDNGEPEQQQPQDPTRSRRAAAGAEQRPDPNRSAAAANRAEQQAGPEAAGPSSGNGSSSGENGGPPSPGVWDEWGPEAQDVSQVQDWGWAAESWAGGARSAQQQQQREQRQQQQQPTNGSSGEHAYGGSRWDAHTAHQRQQQQQQQQGGEYEPYEGEEEYEEEEFGDGPYPGSAGPGSRSSGGRGQFSSRYQPGDSEPDIALLSSDELEKVLPLIPSASQTAYFNKGAVLAAQRWGASLALTVLLSKVALLAAMSFSWPLWWPMVLAGQKNYALRKQFRYAGLWRTQVLEVEITGRPKPSFGERVGGGFATMRLARFLVGDPGGARTEMTLAYDSRYELVNEGEAADLIVLSNSPNFETFKAVKDIYLPGCGVWVSEYPYVDRNSFLEVGLEIEKEAVEEEARQQQQQQQQQQAAAPGYGGPGRGGGYYSGYE